MGELSENGVLITEFIIFFLASENVLPLSVKRRILKINKRKQQEPSTIQVINFFHFLFKLAKTYEVSSLSVYFFFFVT